MNKLQEIISRAAREFVDAANDLEYQNFMAKYLTEYARSVVPEEIPDHIKDSPVAWLGYENCRVDTRHRIDQDLQSLNK